MQDLTPPSDRTKVKEILTALIKRLKSIKNPLVESGGRGSRVGVSRGGGLHLFDLSQYFFKILHFHSKFFLCMALVCIRLAPALRVVTSRLIFPANSVNVDELNSITPHAAILLASEILRF